MPQIATVNRYVVSFKNQYSAAVRLFQFPFTFSAGELVGQRCRVHKTALSSPLFRIALGKNSPRNSPHIKYPHTRPLEAPSIPYIGGASSRLVLQTIAVSFEVMVVECGHHNCHLYQNSAWKTSRNRFSQCDLHIGNSISLSRLQGDCHPSQTMSN
jgi:hypothetical protein